MVLIEENNKILNDDDILYLNQKCENFNYSQKPKLYGEYLNYFFREALDLKDISIQNIITNIEFYVKNRLNNVNIELHYLAINKVDVNSNKDDGFHNDVSPITFISYLNGDYSGGEFEYIDDNNNKIKVQPKKKLTIVMNDKTPHRVLPVTNGNRYSLVAFFRNKEIINPKIIKTII